MKKEKDIEGLWNEHITETNYGSKYQEHIFEQYKLYVQMADNVSDRRNLANTFFITINSLILAAMSFLNERMSQLFATSWSVFLLLAAILPLCIAWWLIVRSYRQLNAGKFKVIGEIEKRLPASPYWKAEWKALGEGKDITKYLPLTHVENIIPLLFSVLYIVIAILFYYNY